MKLLIKTIGVALLGIGLLGFTSGCGKKLVRGSSSSDQRLAQASLKASPNGPQSRLVGHLAGLDETRVGQELDLEREPGSFGRGRDITATDIGGGSGRGEHSRLSDGSNGSSRTAMLTTPASTSSSRFDSPYSSFDGVGLASADSSPSQFGQDLKENETLSQREAKRNGVTFSKGLHDIFFQYDSWRLTEESRQNLEANAEWLKAHPHERISIEGHCDERGTQAYNYVLGEKRATMVQQYLGFLGVPQHQLIVSTFGKDKPECHTFSENCFQKNRRAHFGSDLNLASQ